MKMLTHWLLACAAAFAISGCRNAPERPGVEVARPEEVVDFGTLYAQNCAACHGEKGKNGAAISLADPEYLAIAGAANIQRITANGVRGTAMPPFGKAAGGMLTDRQIEVLARGMMSAWGDASVLAGQVPPAYASAATGNSAQGEKAFATFCAQCHGADATGATANGVVTGSLVEPSYLALMSDQGLRSIILAGQTEQGAHNWRSYVRARPMTDQEISDVIAWLASHRIATPGQVYKQHR
jgi:mono/diheme cytochrome c family protein